MRRDDITMAEIKKIKETMSKMAKKPVVMTAAQAAIGALPFFGGTEPAATPAPAVETPPAETPAAEPSVTDPIEKLKSDPNALGQLLSQVEKLTKDLKTANDRVTGFESQQQEAVRKQQTREQQLEADLTKRDEIIQQMDAIIKNTAIANAVLNQKDIQWHSLKQVVAELNPEAFEVEVDLKNSTTKVSGIDSEIKRVAKDCPWLVVQSDPGEPPTSRVRPSGSPPAPPASDTSKQQRRNELMKKFPVISHGRMSVS